MERGTESETGIFWVETLVFFWNALLKFFEKLYISFPKKPKPQNFFIFFIFSTFWLVSKSMLNVGALGCFPMHFMVLPAFFMASAGSSGGFHAATAASPGSSARAWPRVDG